MNDSEQSAPPPAPPSRWRWLKLALPVLVLAVGAGLAAALVTTAPQARRQEPARQARLVETQRVVFGDQPTRVPAMGTVQPAIEVELFPRVSGQIVELGPDFVPGGLLAAGALVARIDPKDFELVLRQRGSELALAQSDLALEAGNQTVAQREFELLGELIAEEDRALVLRQPQLEKARAAVAVAEAAVDQARLNLERATMTAPFAAVVRARHVNLGMQVGTGTPLATLTGTAAYWIEVTVPVNQLRWIEAPGAPARVFNEAAWGPDQSRPGRVVRLLSDLEPEGRMARLLVEIADPLALEPATEPLPKLLLGSYVRVEIDGRELPAVAAIDRSWIRDGDTVWVMNEQDQLETRAVEVVFRGRDQVLVRNGLRAGERVVTSDLAAPVEGMPLRLGAGRPATEPQP